MDLTLQWTILGFQKKRKLYLFNKINQDLQLLGAGSSWRKKRMKEMFCESIYQNLKVLKKDLKPFGIFSPLKGPTKAQPSPLS